MDSQDGADTTDENPTTDPPEAASEDVQATVDAGSEGSDGEMTTIEVDHGAVEESGTDDQVVEQEEAEHISQDASVVENVVESGEVQDGDTTNDVDSYAEGDPDEPIAEQFVAGS